MKDNRNFGIWSTRPAISKKESAPLFKSYHLSHISCWFELEKAARTSAHKTAAKPNICSHWARKKNICSHGHKTQRLLLFISCPHRQLRAQDAWPPQLPNTSISSLYLAHYKCSKVQILQFWNFLFINNCKYCWLSVQYRSQKFEIWYFLLHLYGLHYPRRLFADNVMCW